MSVHSSHLRFLNPPELFSPPGFSHIVEISGGRTVYLAGQIGVDRQFQIVGRGDFRAQAEQVFENLKTALVAVGADFNQVVKLLLAGYGSITGLKRGT